MKAKLSILVLTALLANLSFANGVNSKPVGAVQAGIQGIGGSLIIGGVVSAVTISKGIVPNDSSGLNNGLSILLGAPIVSAAIGLGVVSGGLDFFAAVSETFKNLSLENKQLALLQYREINSLSKVYSRTGLLDPKLETLLGDIKCGEDCSFDEANQVYQQMVLKAVKTTRAMRGQDFERALDNLEGTFKSNERMYAFLIALESLK